MSSSDKCWSSTSSAQVIVPMGMSRVANTPHPMAGLTNRSSVSGCTMFSLTDSSGQGASAVPTADVRSPRRPGSSPVPGPRDDRIGLLRHARHIYTLPCPFLREAKDSSRIGLAVAPAHHEAISPPDLKHWHQEPTRVGQYRAGRTTCFLHHPCCLRERCK